MKLESVQVGTSTEQERIWFVVILIAVDRRSHDVHFDFKGLKVIIPEQNLRCSTKVTKNRVPNRNLYQKIVLTALQVTSKTHLLPVCELLNPFFFRQGEYFFHAALIQRFKFPKNKVNFDNYTYMRSKLLIGPGYMALINFEFTSYENISYEKYTYLAIQINL
jgi:hypothetical protein